MKYTQQKDIIRKLELEELKKTVTDKTALKDIRRELKHIYSRARYRSKFEPKIKDVICQNCGDVFTRKVRVGNGAIFCPECRKTQNVKNAAESRETKHQCAYCPNREPISTMTMHKALPMCSKCWEALRDNNDVEFSIRKWHEDRSPISCGIAQIEEENGVRDLSDIRNDYNLRQNKRNARLRAEKKKND